MHRYDRRKQRPLGPHDGLASVALEPCCSYEPPGSVRQHAELLLSIIGDNAQSIWSLTGSLGT